MSGNKTIPRSVRAASFCSGYDARPCASAPPQNWPHLFDTAGYADYAWYKERTGYIQASNGKPM